eukprot:6881002-Karenia_brevis.AAC.1
MDTSLVLEEGPGVSMNGPNDVTTTEEFYELLVLQMSEGSVLLTTANDNKGIHAMVESGNARS